MTTKNLRALGLLATLATAACPDQHPAAPQPVQGDEVAWGQNFAAADQQPTSAPAPLHAAGGAMAPTMDWSGGNADAGRTLFAAKCARCHGTGDATRLADGSPVPSIRPAALDRKTERDLARHIAHGHGAMPAFMGELAGQQLKDLIAALRSDVGSAAPAPAPGVQPPAPAVAPAPAPAPAPTAPATP